MRQLIQGGTIVNEGRSYKGSVIIENDCIEEISEGEQAPRGYYDKTVDATGCFVLPGIIDEHVHFREPGMTDKATIETESRAAVYGGITSFLDMPNTKPQTTTAGALSQKMQIAQADSHVNYGFFYGATSLNSDSFRRIEPHTIPGIKLFMGASTGNMLVNKRQSLEEIFRVTGELGLPLMTHCEDSGLINTNMAIAQTRYGDDPDISHHWAIRSEEACWRSSSLAVELSLKYNTRLHIAHLTTARELSLLNDEAVRRLVTMEACIAHLYFTNEDYPAMGALIKCNPSIKTRTDREALRRGLTNGNIYTVATDHAPHLLNQKQGGCARAASGMPMIQFSLVTMLELVDEGILSIEQLVALMAHHPATLFRISRRGFLRKGYKADITIVSPNQSWTVTNGIIQSRCSWSPMLGHEYRWQVAHTFCNGRHILANGVLDDTYRGEALAF